MNQATLTEYYIERKRRCMMKPRTLTIVKGVLFSLIMGTVVIVSIVEDTGQLTVLAFIAAVLLVFGIEVKEIEVGNWLYVRFTGYTEDENQESTEGEKGWHDD